MSENCWCGAPIPEQPARGRPRKYCKPSHRYQPKNPRPTHCRTCGGPLEADLESPGRGRPTVYCSPECRPDTTAIDIPAEEYARLFEEQQGLCKICGRPERAVRADGSLKKLATDHCHSSKTIRGLLCSACNIGLGLFGDDPGRLRRAALYLEDVDV